jgi:hypothetical protein
MGIHHIIQTNKYSLVKCSISWGYSGWYTLQSLLAFQSLVITFSLYSKSGCISVWFRLLYFLQQLLFQWSDIQLCLSITCLISVSYFQVSKSRPFCLSSLYFLWQFILKHAYFMFFSQNKRHFRNNKNYIKLLFLVFITQARWQQLPTL